MNATPNKHRLLVILCLLITAGILIAGLWPFNFIPANKAGWIKDGDGIRFSSQGIVYSAVPLQIPLNGSRNGGITIELLLRAHQESNKGVTSILTLLGSPHERFIVCQWKTTFIIRIPALRADAPKRYREIGVANVLEREATHLVTVTARTNSTDIYVDGKLSRSAPNFTILSGNETISGTLVLGNSPEGVNSWNGSILGLAIHDRVLSSTEIASNYTSWSSPGQRLASEHGGPVALYRFDERNGDVIRDHSGNRNHLLLPAIFQPLRRVFLGASGRNQWSSRGNLEDVTVNILGFAPFGFLLASLFRQKKRFSSGPVVLSTILLGFCLSLAIELAQGYLPTRDSSLLDLAFNTLGTALGAALCSLSRFHFRDSSFLDADLHG